jgi:hypothetical protein
MKMTFPNPDDILNFTLSIEPDEGMYKGGLFNFSFAVNQNFPHDPPKVKCTQKIYHPNIDLDGNVCLNILREDWKPVLNLNAVIVGMQVSAAAMGLVFHLLTYLCYSSFSLSRMLQTLLTRMPRKISAPPVRTSRKTCAPLWPAGPSEEYPLTEYYGEAGAKVRCNLSFPAVASIPYLSCRQGMIYGLHMAETWVGDFMGALVFPRTYIRRI